MVDAAAIVLAGGKSTRMGQNKALVRVTEYKMLEDIIRILDQEFPEIIVSANDNTYDSLGVKAVPDIFQGCGPLGGIYAGLKASGHQANFLVACDMPFTDVRLAAYMVEISDGFDAVVPKLGEYYQPLFALYTKNCLEAIKKQLSSGHNKITSFFPDIRTRFVGIDEITRFGDPDTIFFNVNTPTDLQLAKEMAGRK